MRRWLWYAAALALILAVSSESYAGSDVGDLQPVQTVCVSKRSGMVVIETDTGERGAAPTVCDAFENMKDTAPSRLFLDTAEYLLISPECEGLLPELVRYLRPSCCVCLAGGEVDLPQVGQFLKIHRPERTLMEYRAGIRDIPIIKVYDGRMELVS